MTLTLILLGASIAVLTGGALCVVVWTDRQRRRHRARLRRGTPNLYVVPKVTPQRAKGQSAKKSGLFGRIEGQLAQTSLRVTPTELMVQVGIGVLALYGVLVLFAKMHPLMALPLAIGVPVGVAAMILRMARARYRASFTENMPEALDVFARGLKAGRPVSDSLGIVVKTAEGPIKIEFTRCHDEIRLGTSLPDSLARLETRMPTAEVSFFSVATALQAETGGNLIETMENLADQLRERRKLRKKARALSSEARASAVILAALPFCVALALLILNAGYLAPLWNDSRGQMMSLGAIGSIGFGVYMMARMGKLDV